MLIFSCVSLGLGVCQNNMQSEFAKKDLYMKLFTLGLVTLLASGSVLAAPSSASLVDTQGSVLVNQGKQFVSAQAGQLLANGDRVMVMEGGTASLAFTNGCVLNLESGSMLVVSDETACNIANVSKVAPNTAQAVGVDEDDDNAAIWWTVGAAAVVGIAIWGSNDDTVSP